MRMWEAGVPLQFVLLQDLSSFISLEVLQAICVLMEKVSLKSLPGFLFPGILVTHCFIILTGETRPRTFDIITGFHCAFLLFSYSLFY